MFVKSPIYPLHSAFALDGDEIELGLARNHLEKTRNTESWPGTLGRRRTLVPHIGMWSPRHLIKTLARVAKAGWQCKWQWSTTWKKSFKLRAMSPSPQCTNSFPIQYEVWTHQNHGKLAQKHAHRSCPHFQLWTNGPWLEGLRLSVPSRSTTKYRQSGALGIQSSPLTLTMRSPNLSNVQL